MCLRSFLLSLGVTLVLLLASCGQESPKAQGGILDLTRWNFETQGQARLDGQWELWWNRSLEVPEGAGSPGYALVELPGYWNTKADSPYPGIGAATYHLHLRLPPGGAWSLAVPEISCAWRLTVNGTLVAENGLSSPPSWDYRASVRPRTVTLPASDVDWDLMLYVVNLSDRVGGIRDSLFVGPQALVERNQRSSQMDSAFFFGGLLVMSLFNLVIFFLQRQKKANLWLALFSTFIAIRTLFTGARIIYDFWLNLTFETSAQVEFLCIFGAAVSFVYYLKFLFPEWWPSRVFIPFLFYTALFTVLVFVLPVRIYAEAFTDFYELPLVLVTFVFLGITFWAARKKHEDGLLVFFGMLFLFSGASNDILYQFIPLPQGYVLGRFLFVFLIFNTFILSRQMSKDFALTQRQSGELRKLDKMKDDFLARVTHELRTPLHGMVGILDAFRMGDFGSMSDRQTYHLGLIESSSKRLLSMVNSILDFSNLRKHLLIPEPRPLLLKQTLDFLLPSFSTQLKPEVTLVNRLGDQLPAVLGDEVRLEQVLQHLIQNALQHTQAGSVVLEAEVKDQQIVLSIRDTGTGIPTEKLAQLFTPFHQVNEIDTRITGGLGLGLAISRQLMQQMGGRLDLVSEEGVGTTVLIGLPVCPPARLQYFQTQRLEKAFPKVDGKTPPIDLAKEIPLPDASAASVPGPTVLIVDDEPVNLLVLRTFLNRNGYSILEAQNGPEALEKVGQNVVDLVILDIMMPGMSGFEVCAKIRERFTPARLPVLLLTAKNQVEDLLQGYRSGASDFLTKPFQRDELKARMELHLKVSRAARTGMVVANKGLIPPS